MNDNDKRRIRTELFLAIISLQDAHAYLGHVEQLLRESGASRPCITLDRLGHIKEFVLLVHDMAADDLKIFEPEA